LGQDELGVGGDVKAAQGREEVEGGGEGGELVVAEVEGSKTCEEDERIGQAEEEVEADVEDLKDLKGGKVEAHLKRGDGGEGRREGCEGVSR
jgi:hypothetical protein